MATSPCDSVTSNNATLSVFRRGGGGDGNASSTTDGHDIPGFVDIVVNGGAPSAAFCAYDMTADGAVNLADVPMLVAVLTN